MMWFQQMPQLFYFMLKVNGRVVFIQREMKTNLRRWQTKVIICSTFGSSRAACRPPPSPSSGWRSSSSCAPSSCAASGPSLAWRSALRSVDHVQPETIKFERSCCTLEQQYLLSLTLNRDISNYIVFDSDVRWSCCLNSTHTFFLIGDWSFGHSWRHLVMCGLRNLMTTLLKCRSSELTQNMKL